MGKIFRIIAAVIFCASLAFTLEAWAKNQGSDINSKNIAVVIDYGNVQASRTIEVPSLKGRTILELLQTIAEVKTHPVGQNVFVTSIDGVEGKRGEMAWYYTVDDKSPGKLAYSKILDGTERIIKWAYKKDVCSKESGRKK